MRTEEENVTTSSETQPVAETGLRPRIAPVRRLLAAHWVFALVLTLGVTLRLLVEVAYRYPFVQPDSHRYLVSALSLTADRDRPSGYSVLLRLLPEWHRLLLVPPTQHVLGLAIGCMLYWVLLRRDVPAWGAALATTPVLLDPFQIAIEHYVLSDVAFGALVVGAFVALSIRRPLTWQLTALAGLLLGCAVLTRAVGEILIPIAFLVVLLGQARWRPALVLILAAAVPLGGYMLWYHSTYGAYSTGRFPENILYERVVRFADCDTLQVPEYQRPLCPTLPKEDLRGWFYYGWSRNAPWRQLDRPQGVTEWEALHDFNRSAIRQQPLSYANLVVRDALRGFRSRENEYPDRSGIAWNWRFGEDGQYHAVRSIPGMPPATRLHISEPLARALGTYSRVYLPGPVFAACLLVGLAAAAGIGRARRSGMRSTIALFTLGTIALLLTSTAIAVFSWRYQLVQFWLLPPAAALAIVALTRREPAPESLTVRETARRLGAAFAFGKGGAAKREDQPEGNDVRSETGFRSR